MRANLKGISVLTLLLSFTSSSLGFCDFIIFGNTGCFNFGLFNTGFFNLGFFNLGVWQTGFLNGGAVNLGIFQGGAVNLGVANVGLANTGVLQAGHKQNGILNFGIIPRIGVLTVLAIPPIPLRRKDTTEGTFIETATQGPAKFILIPEGAKFIGKKFNVERSLRKKRRKRSSLLR